MCTRIISKNGYGVILRWQNNTIFSYSYIKCNREPETVHVDPKPVVIIEGIMTLVDKKLRDLMDLKVFVDTDAGWWRSATISASSLPITNVSSP